MAHIRLLFSMAMRRSLQITTIALALFSLSNPTFAQRPRTIGAEPVRSRLVSQVHPGSGSMEIFAEWDAQPGVSRFRFRLARDREFNDIVLDRIISGTETHVPDLAPGKYFWRVAPLACDLGRF